MGICTAAPKKQQVVIEVSAQNQESEKGLAEKLKEILTQKGVSIEFPPIIVNKELLYMKIIYKRGSEKSLTLASGTSEVTVESLDKIAGEIEKKVRDAKNE